jgi:UDP-N-acetylmuramyl pentapeptide phosphotransferase/UDP-N-acetylglucosamine-1-phosphate transferase
MGDAAPAVLAIGAALIVVALLSAAITKLSIRYAHRRGMLDHPGVRRSHDVPTPRGGGIGIVIAAIVVCLFERVINVDAQPWPLIAGIALVAMAGWIDDHRGLGVLPRLSLHTLAAAIVVWSLRASIASGLDSPALQAGAYAIALIACVWSINLHNFMDGINGLLAAQAAFVLLVLAVLCATTLNGSAHAALLLLWAAATLAFLPFNFPQARVFMGDVGSGVLGLLIAVGVLWQMQVAETAAVSGFIACSAFVIDATCNLLSRMLRGKRWYSAHREHLYQWMTRTGMSHARVVAWYAGWNLLLVVPVLYWLNHDADHRSGRFLVRTDLIAVIGIYAAGIALWIFGKRWCLNRVKSRGHA